MNHYQQIFETINFGLVILDHKLRVTGWNRWMVLHSGFSAADSIGKPICELYPALNQGSFMRVVKGVFAFGNYASYSQKLHRHLIPMSNPHSSAAQFPQMQQNCTIGPLRDHQQQISAVYIAIHDVTDFVVYEQKLLHMTKSDGLTGTYNRRYLDQRLQQELERSKRHGNRLSILMLDLDHFKAINDTHGHICGDYALRGVAAVLQNSLRSSDILGRYGGEEFCCVLPETSLEQAVVLAERCRTQIAETDFFCADRHLTLRSSIGATSQIQGDTLDSIITRADEALYQAKREGRNRVCCIAGSTGIGNV